jgi:hypothetical protein
MMKRSKVLFVTIVIIAVYFLHQDFWNWKKAEQLVFGFLPIGLAYHAVYSILASLLMALLVKTAWPKHLEQAEDDAGDTSANPPETH